MKLFPLLAHALLTSAMIGLAAGLHHTPTVPVVTTYTVTGFAVGCGITLVIRLFSLY